MLPLALSRTRPCSADMSDASSGELSSLSSTSTCTSSSNKVIPKVPPRQPALRSSVNVKPRERQHPLDMSTYHKKDTERCSESEVIKANSVLTKGPILANTNSNSNIPIVESGAVTQSVCQTSASITLSNGKVQHNDGAPLYPTTLGIIPLVINASERPVKNVQCNLVELGLHDDQDLFWKETPEDFLPVSSTDSSTGCELVSPMEASYTNSDCVSYEDLLDFALDGSQPTIHSSQSSNSVDPSPWVTLVVSGIISDALTYNLYLILLMILSPPMLIP